MRFPEVPVRAPYCLQSGMKAMTPSKRKMHATKREKTEVINHNILWLMHQSDFIEKAIYKIYCNLTIQFILSILTELTMSMTIFDNERGIFLRFRFGFPASIC